MTRNEGLAPRTQRYVRTQSTNRHPEEPRSLRGVSKDGQEYLCLRPSFEARREERRAPQDDDGG
jgi:hypothetical protein